VRVCPRACAGAAESLHTYTYNDIQTHTYVHTLLHIAASASFVSRLLCIPVYTTRHAGGRSGALAWRRGPAAVYYVHRDAAARTRACVLWCRAEYLPTYIYTHIRQPVPSYTYVPYVMLIERVVLSTTSTPLPTT